MAVQSFSRSLCLRNALKGSSISKNVLKATHDQYILKDIVYKANKSFISSTVSYSTVKSYKKSDQLVNSLKRGGLHQELTIFKKERSEFDPVNILNKHFIELYSKNIYSQDDWEKATDIVLSMNPPLRVNNKNVNTFIMKHISHFKDLTISKSFYNYLISKNGSTDMITSLWLLKAMYDCRDELAESDINMVELLCNSILPKLPVIECRLAEMLIMGLCLTKNWTESYKIIDNLKEYYDIPVNIYIPIIIAAFKNDEHDSGWHLLEDLTCKGLYNETVYYTWLEVNEDKKAALKRLLNFFSKYHVIPNKEFNEKLLTIIKPALFFNTSKMFVPPAITEISQLGMCKNCQKNLVRDPLTEDEFKLLCSSFVGSALVGKDVFRKTNPDELARFQKFLHETAPYDYVLDGLNIAYCAGAKGSSIAVYADKLKTVVKYFVERKKKVLVLGRNHMNSWPKRDIGYIRKNANLFLTDDVSADDPYLLYATMYSGLGTYFLSRDMMKSHKYLVGQSNSELNSIFWRWQCQHQYILLYIENNGNLKMLPPVKHKQSAHQLNGDSGIWHVPCSLASERNIPAYRKFGVKTWLCINL